MAKIVARSTQNAAVMIELNLHCFERKKCKFFAENW
jgi:hypothetical protein